MAWRALHPALATIQSDTVSTNCTVASAHFVGIRNSLRRLSSSHGTKTDGARGRSTNVTATMPSGRLRWDSRTHVWTIHVHNYGFVYLPICWRYFMLVYGHLDFNLVICLFRFMRIFAFVDTCVRVCVCTDILQPADLNLAHQRSVPESFTFHSKSIWTDTVYLLDKENCRGSFHTCQERRVCVGSEFEESKNLLPFLAGASSNLCGLGRLRPPPPSRRAVCVRRL